MAKFFGSIFMRIWFPVIAYSGIIFIASCVPNLTTSVSGIEWDKLLHIIEYAPLGLLIARAICACWAPMPRSALIGWVALFSSLYAVSDEFHQSSVPGRNASGYDLVADTVGGMIGGYIYIGFLRGSIKKRSEKNHAEHKAV